MTQSTGSLGFFSTWDCTLLLFVVFAITSYFYFGMKRKRDAERKKEDKHIEQCRCPCEKKEK